MTGPWSSSLETHFGEMTDPRVDRTKRHKLIGIIAIAICGVICGADGWTEIEEFGQICQGWLKQFLELPNGIPAHDTFGRVFARLDAEEFRRRFVEWVRGVHRLTGGQVVAVDGKTLRRLNIFAIMMGGLTCKVSPRSCVNDGSGTR